MNEGEDPSAEWPEEVKKAYANLKIPSIYDCVVVNEKLSIEIHRQNQGIKNILEEVRAISTKFDSAVHTLVEEMGMEEIPDSNEEMMRQETFEENYGGLSKLEVQLLSEKTEDAIKQAKEVIINASDQLIDLSKDIKLLTKYLSESFPKKTGFFSKEPIWYKNIESITTTINQKVDDVRYNIVAKLDDLNVQVIHPNPGDELEPSKHFILENIKGGKPGTIAQLIKVGYQEETKVLRRAEVIAYN